MKKKIFIALSAFMLVFLSGVFAEGSREKAFTVHFFTGKTETVEWMNALIGRFEAENPGIRVEQEFQKDASNVIKVKLASGDIPDITSVYAQEYADQGLYLDLSGMNRWWTRVNPAIREMVTDVKTGKQYRIATNMTMAGLYYR